MKRLFVFASLFLSAVASLALTTDVKKELLLDIKEETKKCAVEIVNSRNDSQEVAGYETKCNTVKIISPTEAQVFVDGSWFDIRIKESAESDGGDLDDLFVYNEKNELVARKLNVAAYDNVIRAMAGDTSLEQKTK